MKAPKQYVDLCRLIKKEARELLYRNRNETALMPWHHTLRTVEFIPCDAEGERIDEVIFVDMRGLSGKKVMAAIADAVNYYDNAAKVSVSVGIDTYDSLQDMLRGGDYEPGRDWWCYNVPDELVTPLLHTTKETAI